MGVIDIHTGIDLKANDKASTGLMEPQNTWAKKFIESIEDNDQKKFRELLNEATEQKLTYCSLFSANTLYNFIFKHKLGNSKTIVDIVNKKNNPKLIQDINLLKIIYLNCNKLGNLLEKLN